MTTTTKQQIWLCNLQVLEIIWFIWTLHAPYCSIRHTAYAISHTPLCLSVLPWFGCISAASHGLITVTLYAHMNSFVACSFILLSVMCNYNLWTLFYKFFAFFYVLAFLSIVCLAPNRYTTTFIVSGFD